jgi:hypothetical protein
MHTTYFAHTCIQHNKPALYASANIEVIGDTCGLKEYNGIVMYTTVRDNDTMLTVSSTPYRHTYMKTPLLVVPVLHSSVGFLVKPDRIVIRRQLILYARPTSHQSMSVFGSLKS